MRRAIGPATMLMSRARCHLLAGLLANHLAFGSEALTAPSADREGIGA